MSGPSMYRYFASRDKLLATLVTESYEDLASTLAEAAGRARRRGPAGRLRAGVDAFRGWALAAPHRYRLVFGSSYGSGALDPDRIIPVAHRAMSVILAALTELDAADAPLVTDTVLRRQLDDWGTAQSGETSPESGVLLLGLLAWTRMHGIVSLEIEGVFAQVGVDPAHLYNIEIEQLIAQRAGRPR